MLTRREFRALFDGPESLLLPIDRGDEYVSDEMQKIGELAIEADVWIESALKACLTFDDSGSEWDAWARAWLLRADRSMESADKIKQLGMQGVYCKYYAVRAAACHNLRGRISLAKSALEFAARGI